jgi:hypothetical protein
MGRHRLVTCKSRNSNIAMSVFYRSLMILSNVRTLSVANVRDPLPGSKSFMWREIINNGKWCGRLGTVSDYSRVYTMHIDSSESSRGVARADVSCKSHNGSYNSLQISACLHSLHETSASHPRDLTRERILASCTRGFNERAILGVFWMCGD